MSLLLGAILLAAPPPAPPAALVVSTPRGEASVPVRTDLGGAPVLHGSLLLSALNGSVSVNGAWADVVVARQAFRFLLGAPLLRIHERLEPLAASALVVRDTLYLPFQFAVEILPRVFGERYRYDESTGRLTEVGPRAPPPAPPAPARLPSGLLPGHVVTIDPGHGGTDPGTLGTNYPAGFQEKRVTLQIGLLLRDELKRRGVAVRMTRTSDTLISLRHRGPVCSEDCDLFVSLHVNALPRRRGYTAKRGFETYLLGEAKTEDAARVAEMENEAIRYETPEATGHGGALDFILRDLQANEYLRESARAAELIQVHLEREHDGENRGVKQANYFVLNSARRPAVLVEMGYATNRDDARLLTSSIRQQALARALADAVVAYLIEFERKTGQAQVGPAAAVPRSR